MNIVISLLMVLTIVYVTFATIVNKKFPGSISQTAYLFHEKFNKHYLFTIYCTIITFTLLPLWLEHSPSEYEVFCFFACLGVLFAGATPFFLEKFEKPIHYTSAVLCISAYMLWMLFMGEYIYPIVGVSITLIAWLLNRRESFVLFLETTSLLSIMTYLLLN